VLDQILEPDEEWLSRLDPYKRYVCLMQYEHPEDAQNILRLDVPKEVEQIKEDLSVSFPSLF
jgi:hypothetical protein